jgi:hypothetical protein
LRSLSTEPSHHECWPDKERLTNEIKADCRGQDQSFAALINWTFTRTASPLFWWAIVPSSLFEIALALARLDHVASVIVDANH